MLLFTQYLYQVSIDQKSVAFLQHFSGWPEFPNLL